MTEREWLASDDPQRMLRLLGGEVTWRASEPKPVIAPVSDRKMRLFAVAAARLQSGLTAAAIQALECAERLADDMPFDQPPTSRWVVLDPNATRAVSGVLGWISSLHVAIREPIWPKLPALLRTIVGNPFRPVSLCGMERKPFHNQYAHVDKNGGFWLESECPACEEIRQHRDGTIPKIAQVIYDERRWELMPMLADALEEAGCRDEEILRWCRGDELCPKCLGVGKYQIFPSGQIFGSPPVYSTCWDCKFVTDKQERPGGGVYLGCGWIRKLGLSVRGDWCIDLLLGKE